MINKIQWHIFSIFCFALYTTQSAHATQNTSIEWFHQSVNLARYANNISQGFLRAINKNKWGESYIGVAYDLDNKSNDLVTYTDKQVSPILGHQSKVLFQSFRTYFEVRDVNRLGGFPDNRASQDNELRFGSLGYDIKHSSLFFNEWYFNFFYSQLYDHKSIFQGWNKTGLRWKQWDIFNEILVDSFDFTKQEQFTVDARPGIRFQKRYNQVTIQIFTQKVIPIDHSGRQQETRSTLVLYILI